MVLLDVVREMIVPVSYKLFAVLLDAIDLISYALLLLSPDRDAACIEPAEALCTNVRGKPGKIELFLELRE